MDLLKSSATALSKSLQAKKISASEVTEFYLERTKKLNPKLNAFTFINENSLKTAKRIDDRRSKGEDLSPLAGLPVAVKDIFCTKGIPTTVCSQMLKDFIPPYSATVVNKIELAGGINLGKTSMDEFAMGSSNENSIFGPVKNPWNLDYVPGGSSGGSAAALAARMAPLALGTDTGGSIRQPAHFCGVFGIKPTYGRVSRYGIVAYASSLDQAGPMALTTKDCALLLQSMAGHDEHDATCSTRSVPDYTNQIKGSVKGLKIGLPKEYFTSDIEPEVQKVVDEAISTLKREGAEVVEVSLPLSEHAVSVYYMVATSEASSNLARYDGVRFGHRANFKELPASDLLDFYSRSRAEGFGPEVKRRIMLGTYALSSGYYDAFYKKASQVRRLMRDDFLNAFKKCDLLLSPVATTAAFKIGEKINDPLKMYLNDVFTTSTNLAGLPGMSVPCGFTQLGLPVGVQLTAAHFKEAVLFEASQVLENHHYSIERLPHVL